MVEFGGSSDDPQMFEDVEGLYDHEIENRLTVLTIRIEAGLMLSMRSMIPVIEVAFYLPIFEMGVRLK